MEIVEDGLRNDKCIELWFHDKARFGQHGTNSRVWADTGTRPRAVGQTAYEWTYLFAAVCPSTSDSSGWIMPTANTDMMNIHVADLSEQIHPQAHALLVIDQAGWHTSKGLQVPHNTTVILLPPYSPQLNPVELIRRYLRQRFLSNRTYLDRPALEQAVGTAWNRLTERPNRLIPLCDFDCITSAVGF